MFKIFCVRMFLMVEWLFQQAEEQGFYIIYGRLEGKQQLQLQDFQQVEFIV